MSAKGTGRLGLPFVGTSTFGNRPYAADWAAINDDIAYFTGLTQFSISDVRSNAKNGLDDARAMGSNILSARQARHLGPDAVAKRMPSGARICITIDIYGFRPSIASGAGTLGHCGFLYYEVLERLQKIRWRIIFSTSIWSRSHRPVVALTTIRS